MSTERKTGGLVGVELGILYDCRELERLSGSKIVNEVPSNLNHDLRQTANRIVYWYVDFLFGFFQPKRMDGLPLVGQSPVKEQNK